MSCCFARNNLSSEIRRNLDGNYTETKSLTKIKLKMRNSTLLLLTNLIWIASEMLEILTKIFRIIFSLTRISNLNLNANH